MFFKKTIKKVNFTLFTVVKSCEAFQAHMDITFNDAFMDSTWLIIKSTSCFFFNIFNKVENLIISGCLGYYVFRSLVTIKHLTSLDFGTLAIQNKVVNRKDDIEISCTSTTCFLIYQIGIVEGGLETEGHQRKLPFFDLIPGSLQKKAWSITSIPLNVIVLLSVLLQLLTLPTLSTPIQLEPVVISPFSFHLKSTNGFIESTNRSFFMLNTMMENENTGFANILIPFLRSCSQH